MDQWWRGAAIFATAALAYAVAFVIVSVPVYLLDNALGLIEAGNWTYRLPALVLAPFVAGNEAFRAIARADWKYEPLGGPRTD